MQLQAVQNYDETPRSLSDWALDAAFELDEALKGRAGNPTVVDGFFEAFQAAFPYQQKGQHLKLVDASARDRLRGALRQILTVSGNAAFDDNRIQNEIGRLTDRVFKKRLLASLKSTNGSRIDSSDRERAEQLRKFMLKLHKSLIADRVHAAVHWHDRRDG